MINDTHMECIKDEFKESYLLYKQGRKLKAYSSHQPVLIHVLNTIKEGSVLEYGTGFNSTILMHFICGLQGRNLLSLDNEIVWLDKFKKYNHGQHEIGLIDEEEIMNLASTIYQKKFSVAFIDGGIARQFVLEHIKADYIVVHDTELYVERKKEDIYHYDFTKFRHVHHFKYKDSYPMTSLLSNLDKIDKTLLTIF